MHTPIKIYSFGLNCEQIQAAQIKNNMEIPYGYDLLNGKGTGIIESIIKINPHLGSGGPAQFITRSEIVVDEVFDVVLQRNLTINEINQIIFNANL